MKTRRFLFILLITILGSMVNRLQAQDPQAWIEKALAKCESIDRGYYQMTRTMKYMSGADTTTNRRSTYFKKLPNDTLFGFAFNYRWISQEDTFYSRFYSGKELVYLDSKERKASITSVEKWAEHIYNIKHNMDFYDPITSKDHSPLPKVKDLHSPAYSYSFGRSAVIRNQPCHLVIMQESPDSIRNDMMKVLRWETQFWISDSDSLILQYATIYDMVIDNDTMSQFEQISLDSFIFNQPFDETVFSLDYIPADYQLKDYTETKEPEPLANESQAPGWKLVTLKEDSLALSDLRGKLVLVDFFYKSCFPCMKAIPALQSLHEKYHAKGLQVVGINPYDTKEDDLPTFLGKRGVTYPVLLGGKEVAAEYHVSGYPTLYLIDKEGQIIFCHIGYGENMEKEIEEVIQKHL